VLVQSEQGEIMTDEEIHNIYLHMSGKAEGLVEANGTADFPVLFARAIFEYARLTKDSQNMASKSTYKEQLETKDKPVAWMVWGHDNVPSLTFTKPADKYVFDSLYMIPPQRTWVGLTVDEIAELVCNLEEPENRIELGQKIEAKLKEKNT